MKIAVGVSNRHVHLKQSDVDILFGHELTFLRDLKQPHNFVTNEFVELMTPKTKFQNVRVLGPIRDYTQVEISKTDAYQLGIDPPVRTSGDLEGSELITIIGPKGSVTGRFCILANRHIHITPVLKEKYRLNDTLKIKVDGIKGGILDNVYLKTSEEAYFEVHLDTDDANAFLLKSDDEVEIISEDN